MSESGCAEQWFCLDRETEVEGEDRELGEDHDYT
jgi:hypothetical protein